MFPCFLQYVHFPPPLNHTRALCAPICAHSSTYAVKESRVVTLVQPGGLQQMERGAEGSGTLVCATHTLRRTHTHTRRDKCSSWRGDIVCVSAGQAFRSDTIALFRKEIQERTSQFGNVTVCSYRCPQYWQSM